MPLADSTDALSSYQESHEYNEQYQQHQYDPNLYYDPYQHQQQNEAGVAKVVKMTKVLYI